MGGLMASASAARAAARGQTLLGREASEAADLPDRMIVAQKEPFAAAESIKETEPNKITAPVLPDWFEQARAAYKEQQGNSANKTQDSSDNSDPFGQIGNNIQPGSGTDDIASKGLRQALPERDAGDILANVDRRADVKQRFEQRFGRYPLKNYYDRIGAAAIREGVPPVFAFSVIAEETGNGKNTRGNNIMGASTSSGKIKFKTLEDGIDAGMKIVGNIYRDTGGDLVKYWHKHAPPNVKNDINKTNKTWLSEVTDIMNWFYRQPASAPAKPIPGIMLDEHGLRRDEYSAPWQPSGNVDPFNRRYDFPRKRY